MAGGAKSTVSNVITTLRYQDAVAALDWLCEAFGFERHLVVPDGEGGIAHAQLRFGNGMLMLGSARDDEWGQFVKPPAAAGGVCTQAACVIVDDADAHHARALAAGAEIVMAPADQAYGGRSYACRDPEGHVWNFGSYDPWEPPTS